MLGFAHFSPHAIRVVLDRTKFLPFVCRNKADLGNFPDELDDHGKSKVLLVHTIDTLKEINSADFDSVVVFDSADALETVEGLTILDSQRSEEGPWKIKRLTPQDVNVAVGSKLGSPPTPEQARAVKDIFAGLDDVELPPEERAAPKKRRGRPKKAEATLTGIGERVGGLVTAVIEQMNISDGDALHERVAEYRSGDLKSRSFTAQVKRLGVDNKSEPYLSLKKLLDKEQDQK